MKDEGVFIVEQLDGLTSYSSQWLNKTMIDYLDEAITRTPNKTAIIDSKSRYTYKMLGSMVDRVALGLLDLGIKKVMSFLFSFRIGMSLLFYIMLLQKLGRLRTLLYLFTEKENLLIWLKRQGLNY